jgi:2-alkyl-3-oxoalkanoate reductase
VKTKVLVIGSTGFIGTRLTDELTQSSWAEPLGASRRTGVDATDPAQLSPTLRGVDAVVNCLSGRPSSIIESARLLFELAQNMPTLPRIIHMSSMAVYGSAEGEVDEGASLQADVGPYSTAKAIAEGYASSYPRSVIFRPGIIYGPGSSQWSGRIASWLRAGRIGHMGSAADGLCNLVYGDDTVQLIMQALREPGIEGRVFNLAVPQPPTWNDYFARYARALRVPLPRISSTMLTLETKVLAVPLKATQMLGEKVGLQTPDPMPQSLLRLFGQKIQLRSATIEQVLQPSWIPLDEGLARTAAWVEWQRGPGRPLRRAARADRRAVPGGFR